MDHRFSYVVGDLLANVILGMIVGAISWAIVAPWWNMWIAMLVTMPIGMFAALVFFFPAAIKLGAMEAMVPLMLTGMLSAMVAGMAAAMMPLPLMQGIALGGASGLFAIAFTWIANGLLRGVRREAEETADA